jgi:nitroreductase
MTFESFLELAEKRYSVRSYSNKEIEKDKLDKILKTGQLAPTAGNFQPQRIFVLQSKKALDKARRVTPFCFNAPIVLLICSDNNVSWKAVDGHDSGPIDAAISITQMMLEAFDEGIGSCWVRGFDKNVLIDVFDLPSNLEPVALLPIGYPSDDSIHLKGFSDVRKPLDEMVEYL